MASTTQPLNPASTGASATVVSTPECKKFSLYQYNYNTYHSVMDRSKQANTICKVALYGVAAFALVADVALNVLKFVANGAKHVANYVSQSLCSKKVEAAPVVKAPVVVEETQVANVRVPDEPVKAVISSTEEVTQTDEGRDSPSQEVNEAAINAAVDKVADTVAAANEAVDELVKEVSNPVAAKASFWTRANTIKVAVAGVLLAAVGYAGYYCRAHGLPTMSMPNLANLPLVGKYWANTTQA